MNLAIIAGLKNNWLSIIVIRITWAKADRKASSSITPSLGWSFRNSLLHRALVHETIFYSDK